MAGGRLDASFLPVDVDAFLLSVQLSSLAHDLVSCISAVAPEWETSRDALQHSCSSRGPAACSSVRNEAKRHSWSRVEHTLPAHSIHGQGTREAAVSGSSM